MRSPILFAGAFLLLAACSGGEPAEGPDDAGTTDAAAEAAPEATPSAEAAADDVIDAPQSLTASEMGQLARRRLGGKKSWRPGAPIEITGPVAEIILDAPPETYISFGSDPTHVDVFAEMSQPFAQDQQYNQDGFYAKDGKVTVSCVGEVVSGFDGGAPIYKGCFPLFRN